MEGVHGVDVSWLHHANKERHNQRTPTTNGGVSKSPRSKDTPTSASSTPSKSTIRKVTPEAPKFPSPAHVTPPSITETNSDTTPAVFHTSATPSPLANGSQKSQPSPKRPQMPGRNTSEKSEDGGKSSSKRPSWINNISSKFSSSQNTPTRSNQPPPPPPKSPTMPNGMNGSAPLPGGKSYENAETEPYIPSRPKDSNSFFSSLTRRISSASQSSYVSKVSGSGTVCPRKVLNIDPNRERCLVPELDVNKLRRVSFCVDVEIAGGPKYKDEPEDDHERKRKKNEVKLKERGEGEALKNPEALTEEKVNNGEPVLETKSKNIPQASGASNGERSLPNPLAGSLESVGDSSTAAPRDSLDDSMSRKKEKKKRSEAERKERKEQRLKRAQDSGMIPVELGGDDDDEDGINGTSPDTALPTSLAGAVPGALPAATTQKNDRPTTDPARIYRRCCQLRETPILKRITEQLMSPKCVVPKEPGVVGCLDLTGSRMQLPDVVTLGDWLAVVPVKRLLLEDADLNDEGVRVILAGLLAAKKPEPTRRRFTSPRHRHGVGAVPHHQERTGTVEKVTFKNNPRITRVGWKHISLFLYMCRSIKAIDLSMNKFPRSLSAQQQPSAPQTPSKNMQEPQANAAKDLDAADILYKCLGERLGGSRLEELSVSECGLKAPQLRKIIDGAMMCGISRLGIARNDLDDTGMEHVIHYLKSGVCHGVDLGGNDLRDKIGRIAESLASKSGIPCWGLSLADCNLDAASLKPLFSALAGLPNFRFIDLSHNRDLCSTESSHYNTISILRRYMGQMKELKRIHLNDVGMSPKQAIALAEVLPEGPHLAHVSVLENPQLTALANATDEASQEEACALYASFMIAVRCSKTLICIDIDVPSPSSNEVVRALAKQVVAYSLRNMEDFAIAEATGDADAAANAAARLTAPHGGENGVKNMTVPDVLMHLVGHVDGVPENHDGDDPAPDDDYIVGGTGVVKALQYVLGEKANDLRRGSAPPSPISRDRQGSFPNLQDAGKTKAKQMSRNLLDTARKIRARLQPAVVREAHAGDEMAYRRLIFLDQTLQSMIARFEEEYPECRVQSNGHDQPSKPLGLTRQPTGTPGVEPSVPAGPDFVADEDDDESAVRTGLTRRNSDASLASRKLTLEEGRLHRLGMHLRREVIASPSSPVVEPTPDDKVESRDIQNERQRLRELAEALESTPGEVFRPLVEQGGWAAVLERFGANYEDLRKLQEQDPEAWEQFTDAQMKAKMNIDRARHEPQAQPGGMF